MAASDTLIRAALRPGDHLIIPDDAYGGTFRLIDKIGVPWGSTYSTVPLGDLDAVRAAVRPADQADLVRDADQPVAGHRRHRRAGRASPTARAHNCWWTTPSPRPTCSSRSPSAPTWCCTRPPSTSAGTPTSSAARWSPTTTTRRSRSPSTPSRWARVAGPFDAWLTLRGVKTLAVRMDRHCDNAEAVADLLVGHPRVGRVYYPGLPGAPRSSDRRRQMLRFGGMVSFTVVGGQEEALKVCQRTRLFTLGESLGGVESLIEHPGLMTHASVAGSSSGAGRPDPALRRHRGRRRPAGRPAGRARLMTDDDMSRLGNGVLTSAARSSPPPSSTVTVQVVATERVRTPRSTDPDVVFGAAVAAVDGALRSTGLAFGEAGLAPAVGVGTAAPLDLVAGTGLAGQHPGLAIVPVARQAGERYGCRSG